MSVDLEGAQRHAYLILNVIQAAEAAGFEVEATLDGLRVADHFGLVQPTEEDEPWDMAATS